MDRKHFDSFTRLFATTGSRRNAVGALVTSLLIGQEADTLAKKGKGKGKSHHGAGKGHGDNHSEGQRGGPDRHKGKNGNNRNHKMHDQAAEAAPVDAAATDEVAAETAPVAAPAASSGNQSRSNSGKSHKKGKGRNKKGKDKAKSPDAAKAITAEGASCCGAKSCPLPNKGSNSYECAFAGANLSGRDMSLANLGKIDGKKTNFSGANVTGVNFGSACLQGSNFRTADVARTNFGSACLFGSDFTGAKNFNFQVNFSTALLCATILPDGTVSDRDCGKTTTCCAQCAANADCGAGKVCCSGQCKSGVCCAAGDCATQTCQNKTCTNNQCSYTPISGTTGPNCTTQCCNGVCCPQGQTCNQGICSCKPNCTGKVCGSDGCSGSCGACPPNSTCNGAGAACTCNQGFKQCGTACIPNAQCCTNGAVSCPQGQACCVVNDNGVCQQCCGSSTGTCPVVPPDAVCKVQSCQNGKCALVNSANGQPGSNCAAPRFCQDGVCIGCVTPATCPTPPVCKVATCTNGQCGTANKQDGTVCPLQAGGNGVCSSGTCVQCITPETCPAPPTCKVATCSGNTCGAANAANGPGPGCPGPGCCNGVCCTGSQVCSGNNCCQPITVCPAGACGNVPTGCGSTINCGPCAEQVCKTGTCEANNTCTYAGQPNNQPGSKCAAPGFCCNGSACCTSGQVCTGNGCCTPDSPATTCAGGKCGNVTNNCGQTVNCGACPVQTCQNAECNGTTQTCNYTPVTNGQQGPNCTGAGQSCCNGNSCCTSGQVCTGGGCCTPATNTCDGKCGIVVNNCGQQVNCGACQVQTCQNAECSGTTHTCNYTPVTNGQQGPNCTASGQTCCNGNACCTTGQVCTGSGCCTPQTQQQTCAGGKCGNVTNNCGQAINCGACAVQTCQTVTCNGTTSICDYTPVTNGQQGQNCTGAGQSCCNGVCCPSGEACVNGTCVCTATSCPNGCCTNGPGNVGTCQAGTSNTACGTGGVLCDTCDSGLCESCNASKVCASTCNSAQCLTCGTGGNAGTCVSTCPTGTTCNGQGQCVCTAASCANGCCQNGTCVPFGSQGAGACGTSGATCAACPPAGVCKVANCVNGVCGSTPVNNETAPGCNGAGDICCNGFCVKAQAGECPICCQSANDCPAGSNCRGSGACGNIGLEVCVATNKCCVA